MSEIEVSKGWNKVTTLDVVQDPKTSIRIGPFGSSLKKHELTDSGIRVLFIENVVNNKFEFKIGKFITQKKYEKLKGFTVKPNDILVTMMGTIGRICIVPENIGTTIISSHLLKISLDQKKILPKYFALLLQSPIAFKQMQKESRGIAMPGLNSKIIKNLEFTLPPIKTQQKIIQKLDNIFNQFEEKKKKFLYLHDAMLLKIKDITVNFESHYLNKIINDASKPYWKTEKLSSVCEKITDGAHITPTYVNDGIPFLRITDIHNKEIDWKNTKKITELEYDELTKRCKPELGDVLYSKNGTIGISKVVDWNEKFSIFVSLSLLKPKKEIISPYYLKYFLDSDIAKQQAFKRSKTATVTNLHLEEIREIIIPLPPKIEQEMLVKKINDSLNKKNQLIDNCVSLLKKKEITLSYFNNLSSSILHKAFSGKLVE